MRRLTAFSCAGEMLVGTIDDAPGTAGLLIVSGGNELRIGSHRSMAELAARLAAAGIPVFRYDRRGIGDSTGDNGGFESTADDIAAAAAAFRREVPHVTRVVGFGNCDAAAALALFHAHGTFDGLVLSNPWVIDATAASDLPPPAAIRARYLDRLKDPRALWRLATGGVNIVKLAKGLKSVAAGMSKVEGGLAQRFAEGLSTYPGKAVVLLCRLDNTAIAFREAWKGVAFADLGPRIPVLEVDSASHSYQHPSDKEWLFARLMDALR